MWFLLPAHQQINKIKHKINTRPREKLNFSASRECFYEKKIVNLHLLVESVYMRINEGMIK